MTIIETRHVERPSLSTNALDRARGDYRSLDAEQRAALDELRHSDSRERGALLAYLHFIEEEMSRSDWTNRKLGEAVGVSEQAVSQWFKVGYIDPCHLTLILSHEVFGIEQAPTARDNDVHSYRAATGWVRRTVLRATTTPKYVPEWADFVLISMLHSLEVKLEEATVRDLPKALQPYFRGWDRRPKSKGETRMGKALNKWGASYRLFVLEEYYHGKST